MDRTAPILPLLPGVPQRQPHDYTRQGVTNLHAALDVASGKVGAQLTARHRGVEFKRFLARVDRAVPARLALHVICDNSSTHKTPAIQRWLVAHPGVRLHLTPTYSAWLNLVERWFAELTTKWLRRGTHRSVRELEHAIQGWIDTWNTNPRPFVWTKTADQIFEPSPRTANESTPQHSRRSLLDWRGALAFSASGHVNSLTKKQRSMVGAIGLVGAGYRHSVRRILMSG